MRKVKCNKSGCSLTPMVTRSQIGRGITPRGTKFFIPIRGKVSKPLKQKGAGKKKTKAKSKSKTKTGKSKKLK